MARLSRVEKFKAHQVAEEMLARLYKPQQIVDFLNEKLHIPEAPARKIIQQAEKSLIESVPTNTEHRRGQHVARLEALYRSAFTDKRYSTCERVLSQLGEIHGVKAPVQHVHSLKSDEFEGRTDEELEFYASNGHFPSKNSKQDADPLKGLH